MADPWSSVFGEELTTASAPMHEGTVEVESPIVLPAPVLPDPARMYDFWLGGKDNFAVDRDASAAVTELAPWVVEGARASRRFMTRAVRRLARAGIDQFLDIGTGIPTSPNVHEVAQAVNPGCRVVYVDSNDVVLAHARALLATHGVEVLDGDMLRPGEILDDVERLGYLDLRRPVGLLLVSMLHFVPDDLVAARVVAGFTDRLVSGSRVVLSQTSAEHDERGEVTRRAAEVYAAMAAPFKVRTEAEVHALFGTLEVVSPGVQRLKYGKKPVTALGGIGRVDR